MKFIIEDSEVQLNTVFVSLYFYAPWMPYHKKCWIMIEKIEKLFPIQFIAIDTDQFKSLVKRFDITSVPSFLIFKEGQEKKRLIGYILTSAFKSAYRSVVENIPKEKRVK